MKNRTLFCSAAVALGLAGASWMAPHAAAQQPFYDFVHINLPYAVNVGNKTMPAGDYLVQELRSDDPVVLVFYTNNGMKFEASAIADKTLDPNTARDTAVTLRQIGDNYYIDKLWIQGKSFGYKFAVPKGAAEEK